MENDAEERLARNFAAYNDDVCWIGSLHLVNHVFAERVDPVPREESSRYYYYSHHSRTAAAQKIEIPWRLSFVSCESFSSSFSF